MQAWCPALSRGETGCRTPCGQPVEGAVESDECAADFVRESMTSPGMVRSRSHGFPARAGKPSRAPSVRLEGGKPAARLGDLGGLEGALVEAAVLLPPGLAGGREGVDRVVVLVGALEGLLV